jgi:hypothetical protein
VDPTGIDLDGSVFKLIILTFSKLFSRKIFGIFLKIFREKACQFGKFSYICSVKQQNGKHYGKLQESIGTGRDRISRRIEALGKDDEVVQEEGGHVLHIPCACRSRWADCQGYADQRMP